MVIAKEAALDKNQATAFFNNFLKNFSNMCNRPNAPTVSDLEKFFTKNLQLTSNRKQITKSVSDYLNRITNLHKKYSHFEVSNLLEEPIISGNKVAVTYDLTMTPRSGGSKVIVNIAAFATIEDNKIAQWVQVVNEKGSSKWDS